MKYSQGLDALIRQPTVAGWAEGWGLLLVGHVWVKDGTIVFGFHSEIIPTVISWPYSHTNEHRIVA